VESGSDNRNLLDDGTSQKLTRDEIMSMKESGASAETIVETLIDNSTSFSNKTEYSQVGTNLPT